MKDAIAKVKERVESDPEEIDSYRLARPGAIKISVEDIEALDPGQVPERLKSGKAYY